MSQAELKKASHHDRPSAFQLMISSSRRKGIIAAAGAGTRLYPLTQNIGKPLLPVYNKPMIYYALSMLMLGGIRDILIVCTSRDLPMFQHLFGDGSRLGLSMQYVEQPQPGGTAEVLLIGADFLGDAGVSLIYGDNIFLGEPDFFREALKIERGACIFGYRVRDPERHGVVEFDRKGRVVSLEEKPQTPKSNFVVPGLYIYDNSVLEICRNVKLSVRGEREITDVNLAYLKEGELRGAKLGPGIVCFDAGTHDSLLEASQRIAAIEKRQASKIGCIEAIAYEMGFINREQLVQLAASLPNTSYRAYLQMVANQGMTIGDPSVRSEEQRQPDIRRRQLPGPSQSLSDQTSNDRDPGKGQGRVGRQAEKVKQLRAEKARETIKQEASSLYPELSLEEAMEKLIENGANEALFKGLEEETRGILEECQHKLSQDRAAFLYQQILGIEGVLTSLFGNAISASDGFKDLQNTLRNVKGRLTSQFLELDQNPDFHEQRGSEPKSHRAKMGPRDTQSSIGEKRIERPNKGRELRYKLRKR